MEVEPARGGGVLCDAEGVVRQALLPFAEPGYDALNIEAKS